MKTENQLRREFKKHGLRLCKSRVKNTTLRNMGGYRIIEIWTNTLIYGACWELTLKDVEDFLNKKDQQENAEIDSYIKSNWDLVKQRANEAFQPLIS